MNKIFIALAGILVASCAFASQPDEGKQFTTLNRSVTNVPDVLEFFSFNCPHCYQFEQVVHVADKVNEQLPNNGKVVKYHVDFLPPLGKELSHAWAVASALGVEDKITSPLFEAIQKARSIHDKDDIREVFTEAGVTPEEYDAAWNSFVVKALVVKQEKAAEELQLTGVPAMFIKGKYQLNTQGMDTSTTEKFVHEYAATIKFLLNK